MKITTDVIDGERRKYLYLTSDAKGENPLGLLISPVRIFVSLFGNNLRSALLPVCGLFRSTRMRRLNVEHHVIFYCG